MAWGIMGEVIMGEVWGGMSEQRVWRGMGDK